MKAAPGVGIISTVFLTSDCLDEIDFVIIPSRFRTKSNPPQEMLGSNHTYIQSNYFRGGNTTVYDRGDFHAINAVDEFHKYTLEYTPAGMTFSIDDAVVRSIPAGSIKPVSMGSPSPQTPTFVRIGMWASGDPNNKPGVISWGGGPTDYSKPYSMFIKSVTMTNYSPAKSYAYKQQGGVAACNQDNIDIDGGELMSMGGGAVPPAGGSSSAAPTAAPTPTGGSSTTAAPGPTDTLAPPPSTPKPTTTPASNATAKPPPPPSPSPSNNVSSAASVEVARGLGLAAVLLGGSLLLV
jgi:beta-glucanase (GH16 family)